MKEIERRVPEKIDVKLSVNFGLNKTKNKISVEKTGCSVENNPVPIYQDLKNILVQKSLFDRLFIVFLIDSSVIAVAV